MAYKGYSKLLLCFLKHHWVIDDVAEYATMDQNGMENAVSIKRMMRVAHEERPRIEPTSDSSADANTNPASEASTENEAKNAYGENGCQKIELTYRETHYIVRWYG